MIVFSLTRCGRNTLTEQRINLFNSKYKHAIKIEDLKENNGKIENKNFSIVFTTAYNQYAIKFGAFDYLLKPIDVEEIIIVSKKLIEQKQYANNNERLDILINKLAQTNNSNPQKIAVAVQWVLALISIDGIIYFEAIRNYTKLHFTDGKKGK